MFQIDISDKDDNDPFVYAVIDWLGIAQAYISMFKDYEAQDKKGVHFHQLSELPLGTITLQRSIEEATDSTTPSTVCVSGGIADVLLIREGHSSSAAVFNSADFITSPLTAPFDLAVDLAEKSFYSQAAMYRRHRRLPDGTLVETRTRPGRNTQAFLQGLLQYGGQSTLASAEITIIDHKLPYGDAGGYSVQLFPENEFTPAPEHITQMQRYVFFLYARLAWLDEWTKGRGDDFALSVDDIIRFADKYGYDRICGTIRYYSPQGTIPITIHPDSSMLYAIGNALLAEHDQERQTTAVTYHVLDALSLVLQEELRGLEKRNVPVRSVPETYKELCSRYEGKTYLGIAELEAALFERIPTSTQYGGTSETIQLKEGVSIIQAIELQSEKTRIMWLTGLDPEFPGRVFRIAFRNDRFSIQSDYGYVSGRLSSDISIIRDARKHMEHGIRSADEIRKQSRQTTQRDTVSSAFQSLWEQVSQIAPVVSRAEVIAENTVLDTDGSIRQLIDGKPLILRQDPFSGTWFLDITQLEKALADLSQQGETDIYHLSEIHRMVMAAQHRAESDYSGPTAGNCMCPHPAHRNTATPAGSFDAVQGRGHCHNGACGCNWILEGAAQLTPLTTLKPGLQVEDYRLVTDERNRAFEALFGFASCFTGLDSVGAKYLQSRGLQPGNILTGEQGDVGIWGYIPPEVATTIASAASSEVLSILRKHQGRGVYNAPFSEISGVLDRNNTLSSEVIAEIRDHVQQIAETVALYSDKPEEVLLKISFKTIAELAQRGIFGFRSYQGYEYERIGGRILVPTYWPINTVRAGKSSWGKANLNGRGVVIRGKRYYSSPEDDCSFRHIKGHEARPGKGGKRATPVGFWVVSPDHLEEEIQRQGRIVICEGFLNAASLGRLNPDLAPVTIAINGTGYRQIIALLQFLKEKGLPLDTVILEYDFDGPGAGAYQKNAAAITAHIKDITIQPVHTVLPEEIAVKLPPPDPVCFVSGGSHEGMKLDLNDLLRSEEIGAKYAFMSER